LRAHGSDERRDLPVADGISNSLRGDGGQLRRRAADPPDLG
jgi:hypothetical protein